MPRGRPRETKRLPIAITVLPKTKEKLDSLVDKKNPKRYSQGKVIDDCLEKFK